MPELPMTIAEAAEWLRSGKITSAALTQELLAKSHAGQDTVSAFIAILDEQELLELLRD